MSKQDGPPLRALIYNRVSADPSGKAVSVGSQDTENRAWCDRAGWEVAGAITDNDRSASRYASRGREGYAAVAEALAGSTYGRLDVLVCWESSRAVRSLDAYLPLRELCARHGVLFAYKGRVYDMQDGDDRFATGLDALLDEREAERARDRILRSHRASVAAGRPRGLTPYGYTRIYDPQTRRLVAQVPDPSTAAVVEEVVRRVLAGATLYAVAQSLNQRRVLSPRAHLQSARGELVEPRWSSTVIRNLLAKQSLMGIRSHHGHAQGDAAWDAIVSPTDWREVQAVLADPGRARSLRGTAARHLLSGIAECGVCGAWMRPLTNRGRPTYVCGGRVPTDGKGHVARQRPALDAMVIVYAVQALEDPALVERWGRRSSPTGDTALAEERALEDLRARLAAFEESAAAGGLSAPAFGRIEAGILAEIAGIETRRARASRLPAAVLEMAGPGAAQRWDSADLSRQRGVVRALVRVVVHRATRPGARSFDPSTVEILARS